MELRFSSPHPHEARRLQRATTLAAAQSSATPNVGRSEQAFLQQPAFQRARETDVFVRRASATPVHFGVKNTDRALNAQVKLIQAMKIPYGVEVTILTPHAKPEKLTKPIGDTKKLRFIITPEEAFPTLNLAQEVTIGDLNGSHHKLLEHLVMAGLVKMPEDKLEDFVKYSKELNILSQKLRYNPHIDGENRTIWSAFFEEYHQGLLELVPAMKWVGGNRHVRLIGDIVADRGASDSLTLSMIEHLSKGRPQRFRITIGNHDHSLLYYLASNRMPLNKSEQKLSLTNVRHLIERQHRVEPPTIPPKPLASRADYEQAYATYTKERNQLRDEFGKQRRAGNTEESRFLAQGERFLKRGKLISWNAATQTVYMHAPISRQVLKESIDLLRKKGVKILPYDEVNADNLEKFITELNTAYREHVKESVKTSAILNHRDPDSKEKAFSDLVWHRDGLYSEADLPFTLEKHGVKHIVHGHEGASKGSRYSVHYYANKPEIPEDVPVYIVNTDNHARSNNDIFWSEDISKLENENRVEPHASIVASFIDVATAPLLAVKTPKTLTQKDPFKKE